MLRIMTCVGLVTLAGAVPLLAQDVLPAVFSDHMVLQRDMPVPIWGTTAPGGNVTVTFRGKAKTATADAAGAWTIKLDPLSAGGPDELKVNEIVITDVLVGEVWLCSGQSNMAVSYGQYLKPAETAARQSPAGAELRFFNLSSTAQRNAAASTPWTPCSYESAHEFSAVGVYFGRELQKALKVPIGLISGARGSTPVGQFQAPRFDPVKGELVGEGAAMYKTLIAPVRRYALRGAIWYQGEANLGDAYNYRTQLPDMVRSWREAWGQGDFHFLVAQQHSYPRPDAHVFGEMRESQLVAVRSMRNAGIAVTADHGGHKHPSEKEPVGVRLALVARANAYQEQIVHEGPVFDRATIVGDRIRVRFANLGGGLTVAADKITGFTIAGEDENFVAAEATRDGDEILVSSAQVAKPVAVRYGWANPPMLSLKNREGLPVFPFRTDTFRLKTQPAK